MLLIREILWFFVINVGDFIVIGGFVLIWNLVDVCFIDSLILLIDFSVK